MLRIHGHAGSINVRKILWACVELDLAFERIDWGGAFRPVADPEFRALNPVGMIPVIEDGDTIVWESNAILRYLAASRGRTDLLPADPAARAKIEMWMDWQGSDFNNSWRYAFMGLVRGSPDHQDTAEIERSMARFNAMVAILDGQLATRKHIARDDFTLADIPIGLSIHRWRAIPLPRPDLRHVAAYYDRLCDRPGFACYGRDGGA